MTDLRDEPIRIGFQLWGQHASWAPLAASARSIERFGFDSLWANDHFFTAAGPDADAVDAPAGPFIEGWTTLAGLAAETERIPLGMLVSGAGYRNIGLLVKIATALDHLSGGRMTLGLGAGWHRRDHTAFGFELLPIGDRITLLEEQAAAARRLLDGETVSVEGRFVRLAEAVNLPPPLQPRLTLLIGGSGERRTLRVVARYADAWNGEGDPETYRHKSSVLDEHCAAVGRDPASIRRTVGVPAPCVRDSRPEAVDALAEMLAAVGTPRPAARAIAEADPLADTADRVLDRLAEWRAAGAVEAIHDWPAIGDDETLQRLAEARLRRWGPA